MDKTGLNSKGVSGVPLSLSIKTDEPAFPPIMFLTFEPQSIMELSLSDQVRKSELDIQSFYPFLRTLVEARDILSMTQVLKPLSQRFEISALLENLEIKTVYFCYGTVADFQDFMEIAENSAAFGSQEEVTGTNTMASWCMEYDLRGPSYGSCLYIASAMICGNIEVAKLMLSIVKVSHLDKSLEQVNRELNRIRSEVSIEMNRFAEKGLIDSLRLAIETFELTGCGVNDFDIDGGLWCGCTRGQVETASWINDNFVVGTPHVIEDTLLNDVNMILSTTFPDTVLYSRLLEVRTWISTNVNDGGLGYNRTD